MTFTVSALALGACAPPGQNTVGFRDIDWPRADHFMSASESREIEILLVRLGYMRGGADGQITKSTRQAIRSYQRDIGAPITGYVSTPLLNSLRINAPQQAATYVQPAATNVPVQRRPATTQKAAPVRKPTPVSSGGNDGAGGEGGAGGAGGGGWN